MGATALGEVECVYLAERERAFAERLAYSPDEAAELLGTSRELVHDLLRTGQLRSVKAGRRRLIANTILKRSWQANRETITVAMGVDRLWSGGNVLSGSYVRNFCCVRKNLGCCIA